MNDLEREIDALRQRVNTIDVQLLALLNARAAVVSDIYVVKEKQGVPRLNAARTDAILESLVKANRGPLTAQEVVDVFTPMLRFFVERFRTGDKPGPGG